MAYKREHAVFTFRLRRERGNVYYNAAYPPQNPAQAVYDRYTAYYHYSISFDYFCGEVRYYIKITKNNGRFILLLVYDFLRLVVEFI